MTFSNSMQDLNIKDTVALLNQIMEYELAGVTGPYRQPIVQFFQAQASESLLHAQQVGEILTGLEGHPSLKIAPIEETHRHTVKDILEESLAHESQAVTLYKKLLDVVKDASIYLEEFARTMIGTEEVHNLELRKMLRDFS
jgi:bacterioferritin